MSPSRSRSNVLMKGMLMHGEQTPLANELREAESE